MTDERTMQHPTAGGFLIGATAGMIQFFIMFDMLFWQRLLEAGVTAFLSGAAGMLGHFIIGLLIKAFKRKSNEEVSERK